METVDGNELLCSSNHKPTASHKAQFMTFCSVGRKKFWVAPEKLSLKLANEYVILIRLLPPIRQQFQQPQFKLAETSNY